ncbi:hypothetical protein [Bifidobacterium gallicum]|uniref:hypothetical protein n=1 Tax=Bifidobacterium gallicum TaxID=78342 RepID=UPI003B75C7F4
MDALRLRGTEVSYQFGQLIQPENPPPWSSTLLTGIRPDDFLDAPDAGYVMPGFISALQGLTVIGHNVGYENAWRHPPQGLRDEYGMPPTPRHRHRLERIPHQHPTTRHRLTTYTLFVH